MKPSIRIKLFAAISGLILFYVFLSWILNTFLLDKYYFYSKKNVLLESYKQIDKIYKGDTENISLELEKLESTKGIHVIILDKNFEIKYASNQRTREFVPGRPEPVPGRNSRFSPRNPYENLLKLKEGTQSHNTIIETGRDSRLNSNFIRLYALLKQGDYIVLNSSVAAIQESVNIANKFFLFTGIATIITGFFLVFLVTGRFTKPILALNKITKRMATLDFSKRYSVKSRDEIGQLGESINSLSEQLESSIFELREANQKLKEDIEKERKIDEMRKEFISSVSHELKTPIALIQGYSEGLKVNVNEDEENKNFYCDIIMDEAYKMNKLVRQLLDLAQLESGEIDLERTDFDVSELIENVIRKNSLILKEKNIELQIEKEEDVFINADFDRTEQVLTNYINNAVNHLNEYRMIKIKVGRNKDKVRVSVFNSGRDIPEDSVEKIWTSFYKVDKARTRAYGGTGLGLSVVRAIQEAHQNGYGVQNVEGGVEFWFELDTAKEGSTQ